MELTSLSLNNKNSYLQIQNYWLADCIGHTQTSRSSVKVQDLIP